MFNMGRLCKEEPGFKKLELPEFLENTVVPERSSDAWEFGKGTLSATLHCAAVLQCCSRKGERDSRVEAEGEMPKLKIQMADGEVRTTGTKLTDTQHEL